MSENQIPSCLDKPIFKIISEIAAEMGLRAFVIGGFVRDYYLGRPCNDIDIVVEGSGLKLAEAVGRRVHAHVTTFRNFGTAMLHYKGDEVEFVGARKESYNRGSRKPVVEDGTLQDDQLRRDFTINAMAFSLQASDFGALVDPFCGYEHLRKGIIKTPLDPDQTYSDDPLRMLRAVRFATKLSTPQLEFRIVPESMESMRRMASRLGILSRERIVDELNKMLITPRPSKAFFLLDEAGLLPYILPQLDALKGVETIEGRGHKENFSHSLAVLDNVAQAELEEIAQGKRAEVNVWLRWAALLHDIGKAPTKAYDPKIGWTFHGHDVAGSKMVPQLFRKLGLPLGPELALVRKLVWLHLRPIALVDEGVTDSAVRRLLFDAGDDIEDLMLLCNADITSKNPAKVARLHKNFEMVLDKLAEVEAKDKIRNFKNPISGDYIMQVYGLKPCNTIGIIKETVKEAILNCQIDNDFEQADALMRVTAAGLGLEPVLGADAFGVVRAPGIAGTFAEPASVPAAFAAAGVKYQPIGVVDWPEQFPHKPQAEFAVAHSGDKIYVHYKVTESDVMAVVTEDTGSVWEDPCVEFFLSPLGGNFYYNFECNCIGKMKIGAGACRAGREEAPAAVYGSIARWASLGGNPFARRKGNTSWEVALIIPITAFWQQTEALKAAGLDKDITGSVMRCNFYKCGDKMEQTHFLSWSRVGVPSPDFHRPDFFGTIIFE